MEDRMTACAIRPAWTPLTITLTILGFIVFWPLGLAMLAYVIWGDRLKAEFEGIRARAKGFDFRVTGLGGLSSSGNSAFDEYKAATLRRLEEERRRLMDEQRAFEEFLKSLRKARDKEEFDRFMAERARSRDAAGGEEASAV